MEKVSMNKMVTKNREENGKTEEKMERRHNHLYTLAQPELGQHKTE